MSAFEDFVQLELPRRPFLETDVSQERVMVRRGPGPRQLAGVALTEGQVLGLVGGVLTGTSTSALRKYILTVASPLQVWNIPHALASEEVIVQVFDENKFVIIPDSIQIVDANNIQLTFGTPQAGKARVIFLD